MHWDTAPTPVQHQPGITKAGEQGLGSASTTAPDPNLPLCLQHQGQGAGPAQPSALTVSAMRKPLLAQTSTNQTKEIQASHLLLLLGNSEQHHA